MPKKAISAQEEQNRELIAALRAGQARLGERDIDTAKLMPVGQSTYYNRKRTPELFTIRDLRILAKRYQFTDYQLCRIIGIEYHGNSHM